MLILSQDKIKTTESLEFEIIDKDIGFAIYSYGVHEDMGIYITEERAKEVLQEIIKAYKESGIKQIDSVSIENKVVYEMPEK